MSDIQPLPHLKIIGGGHFHRYSTKEQFAMSGEDSTMLARLNGGNDNQNAVIVTVLHRVCNEPNCSGTRLTHLHSHERPYSLYSVHTQ